MAVLLTDRPESLDEAHHAGLSFNQREESLVPEHKHKPASTKSGVNHLVRNLLCRIEGAYMLSILFEIVNFLPRRSHVPCPARILPPGLQNMNPH